MKTNVKPISRLLLALFALLFFACQEQEVNPINIYAEETLDTASAERFQLEGLGEILVNQGRYQETEDGLKILGSIYTASESGDLLSIGQGEFLLANAVDGVYSDLSGYGLGSLPDVEMFNQFESLIDLGSYFSYQSGSEIKTMFPDVPLQDETRYISVSPQQLQSAVPAFSVGSGSMSFEAFFLDPKDPAVYFQGDIDGGSFKVKNAGLGLSANGKLLFEPYEYSEDLNEIMVRPLEPMNGNIYVQGEIPIEKYQIKIIGEMLVGFVLNENGPEAFFEHGIEGGEFRLGANGKVIVNNTLLEYLPNDVELELAQSTLIFNTEESETYLQVAGQMQTGDIASKLLGDLDAVAFLDQVEFYNAIVEGYLYVSDDIDDIHFYISNTYRIKIPGIGEQELAKGYLEITSEFARAGGRLSVPGVGGVEVLGQFFYDGQFLLEGSISVDIDIEVAKLELELGVVVTNNGLELVVLAAACVIGDNCVEVGATVEADWNTGKLKVCANVPGFGNQCATLD